MPACASAAYKFTSLTFAIINAAKYRKYNSPVYSASKAISLASACVSMLTLESTMLIGSFIGIIGIALVCVAYPIYNATLKKERKKIAPEIIRLADELIK